MGQEGLTFNWNTKGAGYTVDRGRLHVFALNRTGALPVSYLADGGQINKYEEDGYKYFAARNDPNLVRVVQYASLYQIFRAFNVRGAKIVNTPRTHPETEILAAAADFLIKKFREIDANQLRTKAKAAGTPAVVAQLEVQLADVHDRITMIHQRWGDDGLSDLAREVANPRTNEGRHFAILKKVAAKQSLTEREIREALVTITARAFYQQPLSSYVDLIMPIDDIRMMYTTAAQRGDATWIRTPSIVESEAIGELSSLTGGHNLDSAVGTFRTSRAVARGEVKIITENGKSVILYSEADTGKLPALLRKAAIQDRSPNLKQELEAELRLARLNPASRTTALQYVGSSNVAERGLHIANAGSGSASHLGWKPLFGARPTGPFTSPRDFDALGASAILVERTELGKYMIFHSAQDGGVEASTLSSALDAIAGVLRKSDGAHSTQLHFSGFTPGEANGFMRSMEIQAAPSNRSLAGFSYSKGVTQDRALKALGAKYDFSKARVTESQLIRPSSPGELHQFHFTVEIPPLEVLKPSLLLKIRLFFSQTVIAPTREVLNRVVQKAFGQVLSGTTKAPASNIELALISLRRELRTMNPGLENVMMKYEYDTLDVFIGHAPTESPAWMTQHSSSLRLATAH